MRFRAVVCARKLCDDEEDERLLCDVALCGGVGEGAPACGGGMRSRQMKRTSPVSGEVLAA